VTERLGLEEALRQAQKMEAIGRLAGGVAHDFNNLLTVIQGRSALLEAHLSPGDPLRRHVQLIEHASLRAAALTRQLLAFSRKHVVDPKVLDVNALLTGLEPMLQRLIGEDIMFVMASSGPVGRVKVDSAQLEQVIMNLVVNARDAMPGGGKLTIETAQVDLDEDYTQQHVGVMPGRYVMLAVSDNGVGMDAEGQAHIFEPFFTTKERGKGTGLGLSMVYGIVKQSGGNIWVYSEPDKGSTFKIYLPQVDPPMEDLVVEPRPPARVRGNETILLVEDDRLLRELAETVLVSCGFRVLLAEDSLNVATQCEQYEGVIDLLLTDVVMPGLSGREVATQVLLRRPGTKVLYMSGYTSDAVVQNGALDADTDFLPKPFTPSSLAAKVRELLDRG
jgi:CheY-like chemotaxis protein